MGIVYMLEVPVLSQHSAHALTCCTAVLLSGLVGRTVVLEQHIVLPGIIVGMIDVCIIITECIYKTSSHTMNQVFISMEHQTVALLLSTIHQNLPCIIITTSPGLSADPIYTCACHPAQPPNRAYTRVWYIVPSGGICHCVMYLSASECYADEHTLFTFGHCAHITYVYVCVVVVE